MDYDWITQRLAQGSFPGADHQKLWRDFDTVVYMATPEEKMQPDVFVLPGKRVLRAPIDDDGSRMTETDVRRVARILPEVVNDLRAGKRVLVTCAQGRNRSGLVVALSLVKLGMPASRAIETVRRNRRAKSGQALTNPQFVNMIHAEARAKR